MNTSDNKQQRQNETEEIYWWLLSVLQINYRLYNRSLQMWCHVGYAKKANKMGLPQRTKKEISHFSSCFSYYFDRSYFSRPLYKHNGDRPWLSKLSLSNGVAWPWPPYFLYLQLFMSGQLTSYSKAEIFIRAKRRCKSIVLYLVKQRKWCKRKQLCSSGLLSHTDKPRIC